MREKIHRSYTIQFIKRRSTAIAESIAGGESVDNIGNSLKKKEKVEKKK